MKTDTRIKDLMRSFIIASELGQQFKDAGETYRVFNYAPNIDPTKEYIVISVLTGQNGQFQTNVLNVNIYVPDINDGSGKKVQNVSRIRTLSDLANDALNEVIAGEYRFRLRKMPIFKVADFKQHAINCSIFFEILNP